MRRHIFHKFNARQTICDGIKFSSRKEAGAYENLKLRQKSGDVLFFLRQIPLHLPGGTKYVCDFEVFQADGSVHFLDVKGFKTPMYRAKKRMVEAIYPLQIEEV